MLGLRLGPVCPLWGILSASFSTHQCAVHINAVPSKPPSSLLRGTTHRPSDHLHPVLEMVKEKFPQGQKGNYFLLWTKPFKRGFDIPCNFFKAIRNKGAPVWSYQLTALFAQRKTSPTQKWIKEKGDGFPFHWTTVASRVYYHQPRWKVMCVGGGTMMTPTLAPKWLFQKQHPAELHAT